MKINKILCALALGAVTLFSACDTDATGSIYDGTETGQGFSFATTSMRAVSVKATDPKFEIPVFRSNSHGDYSGTLTATGKIGKEDVDCFSVSGFSFKDGESKSSVTVDVSKLEIGKVLALTLAFTDSVNMGYTNNEQLTVNVNVDYNWQSLGTGTYVDAWTTGSDANPDGVTAKVEIFKAEGFDRYRVMNPYKEYLGSAQAKADWDNWIDINKSIDVLEIWVEDGLAFYEDFPLGLNYDGDAGQPIYACHPWGWSSMQDPSFWAHNKMEGKVIQLAPYYYIEDVGGWNNTQNDGVIVITLP